MCPTSEIRASAKILLMIVKKTSKKYERRPAAFHKNRSNFQELKGWSDGQTDNMAFQCHCCFDSRREIWPKVRNGVVQSTNNTK